MSLLNGIRHSERDAFDVIIVGGGTAGCVLASRLSEDPELEVALVEAGQNRNDDARVTTPGRYPQMLGNSDYDWRFVSEPQGYLGGRVVPHPRGKLLGGCSAINVQILAYPSKESLDATKELGIEGWDWNTLAPYYQRFHTSCDTIKEGSRGINLSGESPAQVLGPIQTAFPLTPDPLHQAWVKSLESMGHGYSGDPLSGTAMGAYELSCATSPETRERSHSGKAYIDLATSRTNFHLITSTFVEKILLDAQRQDKSVPAARASSETNVSANATGIVVSHNGNTRTLKARKEVILCAGAFGSPQILEMSGIGSARICKEAGIEIAVENSNVGENFQDHMSVGLSYETSPTAKTLDSLFRNPDEFERAIDEYDTAKTGPLSHSPVHAIGFLPTTALSNLPSEAPSFSTVLKKITSKVSMKNLPSTHIQENIIRRLLLSPHCATATVSPISVGVYPSPTETNYFTQLLMLAHPLSRGSVHIRSSNPQEPPSIDPAYLSHPLDRALYALHLMHLETIATTPPLSNLLLPSREEGSKRLPFRHHALDYESALETLTTHAGTFYHPCGTCAMMSRELGGVVDDRLRVYGTRNLRVCDASVIPMIPRGNIVTSVFAWAERGADIIKEDLRKAGD